MSYAIAAAGTGGHLFPALAVADALVASGRSDILFIGGDRMETRLVPEAGFELVSLDIAGLRRSLSLSNLRLPVRVWRAAGEVARLAQARRIKVVLAMGGYVTGPAALGARRAGASLLLHEQNASPGLANRLAARGATRVLAAFPDTGLPGAEVVGTPVRRQFDDYDRERLRRPARARYGLEDDATVLGIMGGSLGAQVVNEAAATLASQMEDVAFIHLAGRTHAEELRAQAAGRDSRWHILDFEEDMPGFYAAADMVVARAGASTVAELMATGTPAVLVPLARVGQDANARYLEAAGAAVVVAEESEAAVLATTVLDLLGDPEARSRMGAAARRLASPNAAQIVAEAMMEAHDG